MNLMGRYIFKSKQLSSPGKLGIPLFFCRAPQIPMDDLSLTPAPLLLSSYHIIIFSSPSPPTPHQLQCYQVGLKTPVLPPASCKSFIHFWSPRLHVLSSPSTPEPSKIQAFCLILFSNLVAHFPVQDHKPVLTTLCSSPERFIINRL